jgi:hypothetical protein
MIDNPLFQKYRRPLQNSQGPRKANRPISGKFLTEAGPPPSDRANISMEMVVKGVERLYPNLLT